MKQAIAYMLGLVDAAIILRGHSPLGLRVVRQALLDAQWFEAQGDERKAKDCVGNAWYALETYRAR